MAKVLVSNHSELIRHFGSASFQKLAIELIVAKSPAEAFAQFDRQQPALVIVDIDQDGFAIAKHCKAKRPAARVVVVASKQLTSEQTREVTGSGADELLITPVTEDELYDVVTVQLGTRPGGQAFTASVKVAGKPVEATVSNLSLDGMRLIVTQGAKEGQSVEITITAEGAQPVVIAGNVLWAQPRDGKTVIGIAFENLDVAARLQLAKLTQWQVMKEGERTRVVLRGDFTEATKFDELAPAMVGRVVFDMAQVTYMNSLGVRAWCEFLRQARISGYEFHACSVPFVLQASMVRDVIGRGSVSSFFAPFHCISCDHQEERLLQSSAVVAANLEPPVFKCPNCGGALEFDDLPERYFAFLQEDDT